MKNTHYVYLLFPILAVANIIDNKGSPPHAILEAEINVLQGKTIYANGKMQSVVRISYILNTGYMLEDEGIKIKQFGSGKELSELGWSSSTEDNGYDHNIGSNTRNIYNEEIFNDPKLGIKQFYISTKRASEGIEMCFEIKTKLKINSAFHTSSVALRSTGIYSTCIDESIAQGTDRIFARRPVIYTGQDFTLLQTQTGIELKMPEDTENVRGPDLLGLLYIIYPGPNIPRKMTFKLKNESDFFPENYIDSDVKAVLKKKKSGEGVYGEYWYAQSVLFIENRSNVVENKYVKVFLIDYSDTKKAHHVFVNSNLFPEALLHIWHVKYARKTYIVKNMRCNIKRGSIDRVCSFIDNEETFTVKTESRQDSFVQSLEIPDKPSRKMIWIDNYGTEHPVALVYGFGERELDLDII